MDLIEKVEDLITKGAEGFEVSKAFRESIKEYLNSLEVIFEENQGKDFLVKHTKAIDGFITLIYKYALRVNFDNYIPMTNSIPISIIALGSYGREQLSIYSDIDLMIVYKDIKGFNTKEIIEKILYTIWDANLKLGHRVHEVEELTEVANTDITIKTALIESRFICGSKFLWFEVQNGLNKIRNHNQREFIIDKLNEYSQRRDKYPISMEAFIKEGNGGLRDANTLFWIANAMYGVDSLKQLIGKFFSEDEYKEYRVALEFMFRVRTALHLVTKKKQDRLILEYIPDISKKLGFKDTPTISAERALVSKTLQSIWTISTLSDIFINKITKRIFFNKKNISILRESRIKKNLYILDSTLYTSFYNRANSVNEILRLLNSLPENIKFDSSFINLLGSVNIEKKYIPKELIKKLFYKESLYYILKALFKANLLHIIIPQFKKVLFLAQFDGYHKYPVDNHSLKTVYHLENIKDEFIKGLFLKLSNDKRAILKIVALLHDAGKGRKIDHSIAGEKLFKAFVKKLDFSIELIDIGSTLIRQHTLMSSTAYHEDIYNERVILSFISYLKNRELLEMLYILTYADINGVGTKAYSNFTAKLLKELYLNSIDAIDKEELIKVSSRRVKREEALKKSENFKSLPKTLQKKILNIESNLLFLKFKVDEIVEVSKWANHIEGFNTKITNEDNLIIEIVKAEDLNLGYLLGKLSFLDIAHMDIFKLFNDKKYFRIEFRENIDNTEVEFIREIIDNSFDMTKSIKLKKPTILEKEIDVDLNHSKEVSKIQIKTKNQSGLVAYIAKVFDDFNIDIRSAKISTLSNNRVSDIFLVKKSENLIENIDEVLKLII